MTDSAKPDTDPWLDTKGLAAHTNLSESFWEKMRAANKGPKWVRLGRACRTRRSWADAYMESQGASGEAA